MSSEKLDWSDPKKLQRRDGGEVLACGKWEKDRMWVVSVMTEGDKKPTYTICRLDGRHDIYGPGVSDIIPRPREPQIIEVWVSPGVFAPNPQETFVVYTDPKTFKANTVKVRITEVIDE